MREYRYRNHTINSSPNMLMKKMRSVLPVAGPSAEKANINNPDRKRCGFFCLIQVTTPMRIRGMTKPKDISLLIIWAHPGVA